MTGRRGRGHDSDRNRHSDLPSPAAARRPAGEPRAGARGGRRDRHRRRQRLRGRRPRDRRAPRRPLSSGSRARSRRGPQRARHGGRLARARTGGGWRCSTTTAGSAPGWLPPLVACGERLRRRIWSAGRSRATCRRVPGAWRATASSPAAGAPRPGRSATLSGAQNLLIARGLVDLLGAPLFRSAYDRSGGEDYDLFRRAAAAGARMAWCAEPWCTSRRRPEQLRPGRLLARYYSTGLYTARIDRAFDGAARTWARRPEGARRGGAARPGRRAARRLDARGRRGADARPLRRPRRRAARRRERPLRRAMTGGSACSPPRRSRWCRSAGCASPSTAASWVTRSAPAAASACST